MDKRGGARPGAGRPKGTGKWKEPTIPVRLPVSLKGKFDEWLRENLAINSIKTITEADMFDAKFTFSGGDTKFKPYCPVCSKNKYVGIEGWVCKCEPKPWSA